MARKVFDYNFEDEDLRSYRRESLVVLCIKKNAFEVVTDLSESNHLFNLMDHVEKDSTVHSFLVINNPGTFGEEEYAVYMKEITGSGNQEDLYRMHARRVRQINILNHFISRAIDFQKPVAMGLQGTIVTPFFGAALAVDLRFGCEKTVLSFAHLQHNVHPTGALPLLLPQYVGIGKARDLLLRGGKIKAKKAKKWGMLNNILSCDNFEEEAINLMLELNRTDPDVLNMTRRLFNVSNEQVERYFDFESRVSMFK